MELESWALPLIGPNLSNVLEYFKKNAKINNMHLEIRGRHSLQVACY